MRAPLEYCSKKEKAVMFFSASSISDAEQLYSFGIREILTSYHYIKKSPKKFSDLLERLKNDGGLFMTDSGAFSFFALFTEEMRNESYWIPYIEEYVSFLKENSEYIYCCANLDIEAFVGCDVVDKWNEKYFRPLEKLMNVVYIPHNVTAGKSAELISRFKLYCSRHEYVGVPSGKMSYDNAQKFYTIAKSSGNRVHGFGWTSIPTLKSYPFFSVDSTTWLGGVRYGTSYRYSGKNFVVNNHLKKYVRKIDKELCRKYSINYADLLEEKRVAINQYNLVGWIGARKEYLRSANVKLKNKPVNSYKIRYGKENT